MASDSFGLDGQDDDAGHGKRGSRRNGDVSSAFLVEAATIETRLRKHALELLEPTIRKQGVFDNKLKETKRTLDRFEDMISTLSKKQDSAIISAQQLDSFRVELAEWDKQRHAHEQAIGDRVSMQETEINSIKHTLIKIAADRDAMGRTHKAFTDILEQTRIEMSELRHYCSDRMDTNRDKVAQLREEVETRITITENEMHRCTDNQVEADTAISHMKTEFCRMSDSVCDAVSGVQDLHAGKASIALVMAHQSESLERLGHINEDVDRLRQQFCSLVEDVKAHFHTGADVLQTSVAQQIDSLRGSFVEEVARMDSLQKEVEEIIAIYKGSRPAQQSDVERLHKQLIAEMDARRADMDDATAACRKMCANLDVEGQQTRRALKEVENILQNQDSRRTSRSDLLSMLLESQLLAAALALQDDQDRRSIALFGYKHSERDDRVNLPQLNTSKGGKTPRRPCATTQSSPEPVITLDKKCMSCCNSGNTRSILAGFKLACLQYNPTPVEYQKASYSREELIRLQMDLLSQAKERIHSLD